jgi:hypothetical protein
MPSKTGLNPRSDERISARTQNQLNSNRFHEGPSALAGSIKAAVATDLNGLTVRLLSKSLGVWRSLTAWQLMISGR